MQTIKQKLTLKELKEKSILITDKKQLNAIKGGTTSIWEDAEIR